MHLTVRCSGEPGFTWDGTVDDLDKLEDEMEALALKRAKDTGGSPASEVATHMLGRFAHGRLPEPRDETQALGIMRWLTYAVLQLRTDYVRPGTQVRDLMIASDDVICDVTPAGEGRFTATVVGYSDTEGEA